MFYEGWVSHYTVLIDTVTFFGLLGEGVVGFRVFVGFGALSSKILSFFFCETELGP